MKTPGMLHVMKTRKWTPCVEKDGWWRDNIEKPTDDEQVDWGAFNYYVRHGTREEIDRWRSEYKGYSPHWPWMLDNSKNEKAGREYLRLCRENRIVPECISEMEEWK